jgi:hypothetical protein
MDPHQWIQGFPSLCVMTQVTQMPYPLKIKPQGKYKVLPAAGGVEGDGHPDEPHGDDDAAPAPPRHCPAQDDAGYLIPFFLQLSDMGCGYGRVRRGSGS